MATFLATSGITYQLEQLLSNSCSELVLVSPYLRVHEKFRLLIQQRAQAGTRVQVVYGKGELHPQEMKWLEHSGVQIRFSANLHAKCYMNEESALVTSMNLHQHSQANNYEMGFLVHRQEEPDVYAKVATEVQTIVTLSSIKVDFPKTVQSVAAPAVKQGRKPKLVSASGLAKQHGTHANVLFRAFFDSGLIDAKGATRKLTPKGEAVGAELRYSEKTGEYIVWPEDLIERLHIQLPK